MESKEFKNIFGEVAKKFGFEKAFGGWFKESQECIAVLDLQKSNFGDYYQLNIKIFVQGMFGACYNKNKNLVKKNIGEVQFGEPQEYRDVFDFDNQMEDEKRKQKLETLFAHYIDRLTRKSLTKNGIKELVSEGDLSVPPAIKQQLGI